jgi:uncharacterized protein YjbI with pentapeptide repeats
MDDSIAAPAHEAPPKSAGLAAQKDNVDQLSEISRNSQTTFVALILACVYSYLAIATTTDAALISNSSATPLPIIQVNVPIVWFYHFAPIILAVLFAYFHLYLERFWRCLARLPLWHPDGRGLDDYVYPWLISSTFIRGGIPQLAAKRVAARLEAWLSLLLAWWLVPIVLLFYWSRYLAAHDWVGTVLHLSLILITAGFALRFYFTAKNALNEMARSPGVAGGESRISASALQLTRRQVWLSVGGLVALMAVLGYLSAAAIRGLAPGTCDKQAADSDCRFYSAGRWAWEKAGFKPRIEVREHRFVTKPENWDKLIAAPGGVASFLETQRTLTLDGRDLRDMDANGAFLAGSRIRRSNLEYADLQHAILTGSRLEDVELRGANLEDADFQHAQIDNVDFDGVFAKAARFNRVKFKEGTADTGTRLSGIFHDVSFEGAEGQRLRFHSDSVETTLQEARLREAKFDWAEFDRVDLSLARIEETSLANSKFNETDFSDAVIVGSRFDLSTFTRCKFVSSKIQDSFFMYAKFIDTEFNNKTEPLFDPAKLQRAPRALISRFHGASAEFISKSKVRNIQFEEADLRSARFDDVELQNIGFTNSDLSYAVFANVDLSTVEFRDVDLSNADLTKARGVSPRLLSGACGNAETQLPGDLRIKRCGAR